MWTTQEFLTEQAWRGATTYAILQNQDLKNNLQEVLLQQLEISA